MIHVDFWLNDRAERDILNEALDKIAELRLRRMAALPVTRAPVAEVTTSTAPAPEAGAPTPAADEQQVPTNAAPTAEVGTLTTDDCIAALRNYHKSAGFKAARAYLDTFGVNRVQDLQAERYGAFVAGLELA